MAYKTLSASVRITASAWLHDLFAQVGACSNQRTSGAPFADDSGNYTTRLNKLSKTITDEIFNAAFADIDQALTNISQFHFVPRLAGYAKWCTRSETQLAEFIADWCAQKRFFWDDTLKTPYELEEFKKTYLGKALEDFGCYISQADPVQKSAKSSGLFNKMSAGSTSTSNTKTANPGQPKNDYKSSGAQSGNVRDLKGTPGNKINFNSTIYAIEGNNSKAQKVKAFAFIKPLAAAGASGNTNKVFLGSSNGYTDCKLYFETYTAADAFLVQCQKNCPTNISNLAVVRKSADKQGYYEVGTEYGDAYISAKKLNESLGAEEDGLDEAFAAYCKDIEEFDTNFHRYY